MVFPWLWYIAFEVTFDLGEPLLLSMAILEGDFGVSREFIDPFRAIGGVARSMVFCDGFGERLCRELTVGISTWHVNF